MSAPSILTSSPVTPVDTRHVQLRRGHILAEITAGIAATGPAADDLAALLQRFLDPVVQLAGACAGAVRVLADDGQALQQVGGLGGVPQACGAGHPVDRHCGACGAAADGQPLVWARDLAACSTPAREQMHDQGCHRLLAVPLQHRGQTLGVYNLFFDDRAPDPSDEVMSLLRSVGDLLGLALHNARLEQERLHHLRLQDRQAMAAEVHDAVAQAVTFVKMRMPLLEDALRLHDEARALRYCADVREAAGDAHAGLRALLTDLRTPANPLGLRHALDGSAARFRRQCDAALEVVNDLPELRLSAEGEAQVAHIVQEALANVSRHAHARSVRLHVVSPVPDAVQVVVEDDGHGLPAGHHMAADGGAHYGLQIMSERAARLGGRLDIGPRRGGGTRVCLTFPRPHAAGAR